MRDVVVKYQFCIFAITVFAMSFVSCGDEDKINSTLPRVMHKVGEAKDLAGVIHYDQSNLIWYISVDDNNSLDTSIQRLDIWDTERTVPPVLSFTS